MDLDLQKGDLEYFNNLTVYHGTSPFLWFYILSFSFPLFVWHFHSSSGEHTSPLRSPFYRLFSFLTARFRADSFPARTASTDSDKNARHLIRIWLENKDQPLPAQLRTLYAKINAGQGKTWPLEAWDTNPYLPTESAEEEKKEGEGASYD